MYYLASSSRSRAVLYLKSDPCPGQPLWLHLSALMSPKASIFHSRYLWATFDIKCLSLIKVISQAPFEMCNLQICPFHDKYHESWPFCIKDTRLCSVHNNGLWLKYEPALRPAWIWPSYFVISNHHLGWWSGQHIRDRDTVTSYSWFDLACLHCHLFTQLYSSFTHCHLFTELCFSFQPFHRALLQFTNFSQSCALISHS